MPKLNENLKNDVIKITVDKLLIGVVLAILGFFASNMLEERKSNRAFVDELNKTRAQKLGEVWEMVSMFDSAVEDAAGKLLSNHVKRDINRGLGVVVTQKQRESELLADASQQEDRLRPMYEDTMKALIKNRFWLGENEYQRVRHFLELDFEYFKDRMMFLAGAVDESKKGEELKSDRDNARLSVIKMWGEMLGKR
jgi:hypothetical protein